MTTLEFEPTPEEHLRLNLHFLRNAPAGRKQVQRFRIYLLVLSLILVVLVGVTVYYLTQNTIAVVAGAAVVAILLGLLIAYSEKFMESTMKRSFYGALKSGKLQYPVELKFTVETDGLKVESGADSNTIPWAAFEQIDEGEKDYYIFIEPAQAMIIPKRIGEERAREFMDAIKEHRSDL